MQLRQDLLNAVSSLEIRAKKNVTSLLTGNYRSTFRGSGMQFKEFRHYEPGDDIRHMSWQVTARTGRATVKTFEEERELDVVIMVDVSGSGVFGSKSIRKVDVYAELVALIGLAAIKSGDNMGLLLFSDKPGFFLPPKRTRHQVIQGTNRVLSEKLDDSKSDLRPALKFLYNVLKKRSIVIVISDFLFADFELEMRLMARRHEVVALHCFDEVESGSKLSGIAEICDPETGEFFLLDGKSKRQIDEIRSQHVSLQNRLQELSHSTGYDTLSLSVEDDYIQKLVHFFKFRGASRL